MKKKRKILLYIIIFEFVVMYILSFHGFKPENDIQNAIGTAVLLIAPCTFLFLCAKDRELSMIKRVISGFLFVHIIAAYIVCVVMKFFNISIVL